MKLFLCTAAGIGSCNIWARNPIEAHEKAEGTFGGAVLILVSPYP